MASLMEIWDKAPEDMEGEIDQTLPAGKYVLRFLRATTKIKSVEDKQAMDIYINFSPVRPLDRPVDGFVAAKYETLLHTFRDRDAAQFIRFLKVAEFDFKAAQKPQDFLNTQVGRSYVADVTYSNPNAEGRVYTNLRGLMPLDVYEAKLARLVVPVAVQSEDDDVE